MNCSSNWRDYTNACWAANWHRFFTDDPNDARGKMGWPNRFQDALSNAAEVFNYYSSGDEVFHETDNPPWLLSGLDEFWATYCWQKQETLKGSMFPAGTAFGGWRFYTWRIAGFDYQYMPTAAAAMVADGSVTNNPVFNRGFSPMFDHNASLDDQWLALAKYVPAVSSPLGGMLLREDIIENHDLNEGGESCAQSRCSCRANQDGNVPLMGIMSNIDRWPERDDYKNPIWKLNCQSEVSRRSRSHSRISSAQKRSSRVRIGSMAW